MAKYIIKYGRDDRVKFISHLDFVRCFHRAVRRSPLNFEFSNGFNPHPIMTIAQPLPVGVTSESEYMKVGLVTEMPPNKILKELNIAMPSGFKIYTVKKLKAKEFDLTKIDRAEYIVEIECNKPADVNAMLLQDKLIVPKKTKSGIKDSDIRPHIFSLENIQYCDEIQTVRMIISCGSNYNLKPQTVVEAMNKYCNEFRSVFSIAHRKKMLICDEEFL